MNDLQQINFTGVLDTDTDPLFVNSGDYTSAQNVRHLTDGTESTQSIIPIKGNKFVTTIPAVTVQNKKYIIYLDSSGNHLNQINFYNQNTIFLGSAASFGNSITEPIATYYNAAKASILAGPYFYATSFTISSLTTTSATTGSFTLEITNIPGNDYSMTTTLDGIGITFLIYQEAIDASLVGNPIIIGSYDLLGDLFVWSTTQRNLPSTLANTIVSTTNTTPVQVTYNSHGLISGQKIKIENNSVSSLNGYWIVGSITMNTFILLGSVASGSTSSNSGIIKTNLTGIGEVGVQTYNPNSDTYTYTSLIRSKILNFVTKKQIDCHVEQNNIEKSFYFTDDYNDPRAMYYKGAYITNGFLTQFNSEAEYDYETLNEETILILSNTSLRYIFNTQYQSGGGIKSGNWRYPFRFVTTSGVTTQWSDLSNPVPVFLASTDGAAYLISGDESNITTSKINEFIVSGILPNLFQYIEMAAINYVGSAISGIIVSRNLLGSNTSITLRHTGLETGTTELDLGTLNQIHAGYSTAKNICAVDNRLILSKLTTVQVKDFSEFSKTFKHSIKQKSINSAGFTTPPGVASTPSVTTLPFLRVGEYNDPNNVYNYMGYMHNEVYRISAKYKLKNGTITSDFWIDDIRIDTSSTNINNESPNRRVAGLPNFNLTSSNGLSVLVPYIEFSNIDLTFLIDGVQAIDLIDTIYFERCNVDNPEILTTGMAVLTVSESSGSPAIKPVYINDAAGRNYNTYSIWAGGSNPSVGIYGEFEFISGNTNVTTAPTYPLTGNGGLEAANSKRDLFSFYSPDILFGEQSISFLSGDKIINFGTPGKNIASLMASGTPHFGSAYSEYSGYTNINYVPSGLSVTDLQDLSGIAPILIGGVNYSKYLKYDNGSGVIVQSWINLPSPVISTQGSNLTNASGLPDYGFYYVQYRRPRTYTDPDNNTNYGTRTASKYIPTGTSYQITSSSPSTIGTGVISVFGGDIFTQKSFLKHRFPYSSTPHGTAAALGWGGGVGFYSQNRVNTQLNKRYGNTQANWNYPNSTLGNFQVTPAPTEEWLELTAVNITDVVYNSGYNIINGINSNIAFDPNTPSPSDLFNAVAYSLLKLEGGLVDGYRQFLPLNIKYLDAGFGEIIHMANANGELVTWQIRKLQIQYFNTRGVLQESNLSILIGDGSVFSRDGKTLSVFGTKHKWSVIKGKSAQGNDVFYWVNTELKKLIRYGFDGTISLADVRGLQSFLANNLAWVDDKDTPADGQGICGVWDDRYFEALFTVRGKRVVNTYISVTYYSANEVVSYNPIAYSTFEKTGEFYVSKVNSNVGNTPPNFGDTSSFWEMIPHTGSIVVNGITYDSKDYYNEYTLVFNELKNGFAAFYSPLPTIYLKWKDSYFSPKPIDETNRLYLHNKGEYLKWYDNGITSQQAVGFIEGVVNKLPSEVKWMSAIRVNSDNVPNRIDFTNKTQASFLISSEFDNREGNFDSPIKMDSTGQTVNDAETSRLYGKYLKAKMTFVAGMYQKLYGFIIKFRISPRVSNK